jgi:hypothetical protein
MITIDNNNIKKRTLFVLVIAQVFCLVFFMRFKNRSSFVYFFFTKNRRQNISIVIILLFIDNFIQFFNHWSMRDDTVYLGYSCGVCVDLKIWFFPGFLINSSLIFVFCNLYVHINIFRSVLINESFVSFLKMTANISHESSDHF